MKLLFVLGLDGHITVKVEGVSGPGCQQYTTEAEQLLGVATARTKTPEYYQRAQSGRVQQTTTGQ
jgi:hypothetical protein